jgi:hypothetical protein
MLANNDGSADCVCSCELPSDTTGHLDGVCGIGQLLLLPRFSAQTCVQLAVIQFTCRFQNNPQQSRQETLSSRGSSKYTRLSLSATLGWHS